MSRFQSTNLLSLCALIVLAMLIAAPGVTADAVTFAPSSELSAPGGTGLSAPYRLAPYNNVLALDGVNDYASAPDSASLDLGAGATEDFTIETFFYVPNIYNTTIDTLIWKSGAYALYIVYSASDYDVIHFRVGYNGSSNIELLAYKDLTAGWHHVAAVFDNEYTATEDSLAIYLDGSRYNESHSADLPLGLNNTSNPLYVGTDTASALAVGWLDEMRFSDNARYSGVSYSVPGAPFTVDANTRALWHFNEAEGSTTFYDSGASGNTLVGSNGAQTINPFGGATPPSITMQPQSQSISSGQTATLSVSAAGSVPLNYQWYRGTAPDTSNPVGSNSNSYTTPALTTATSYWVRVSNAYGHVDSDTASITILGVCPTFPTTIPAGDVSALTFAISCANSNGGGTNDVINLSASPYTLVTPVSAADSGIGLPIIQDAAAAGSLRINGNGATIRRSSTPGTSNFRLFEVAGGGDLTLDHLTLSNGAIADSWGGAILSGGTLLVSNSVITSNFAYLGGGGIYNQGGTLTIVNSTFSDNTTAVDGGGILSDFGGLTLNNSTFSGNSASWGGGLYYRGMSPMHISNSTFSGNSASSGGGGVLADGELILENSIIANSSGGDCDCSIATVRYSLIEDGSGGVGTGPAYANGNLSGDPLLDLVGLQNNGGPTPTIALLAGSTAINMGDPAFAAPPTTDQRGTGFARVVGGRIDMGAYEDQSTCPSFPATVAASDVFGLITAVNCANANGEGTNDVINLSGGTYTLHLVNNISDGPNGLPIIVDASAAGTLTINGSGATIARSGVGGTVDFRIFQIAAGGSLTLNNLTVQNASSPDDDGGGAANHGTLNVSNSTFSGNVALHGGGIANYGSLNVDGSTFTGNVSTGVLMFEVAGGGGIENSGTMTVTNTTFSGNLARYGAGIETSGTAVIGSSTFSDNVASGSGGGIWNYGGMLTVTDHSLFMENTAGLGAGIWNYGTLTVSTSTFSGNSAGSGYGGGIYNSSSLSVDSSTFSQNSADWGGAIDNWHGSAAMRNSTLTGNSAIYGGGITNDEGNSSLTLSNTTLAGNTAQYGGGIYNLSGDTITIYNSTISGNSASQGGGIRNDGTLHLHNSILANSAGGGDCVSSGTAVISYSLVENGSCGVSNGVNGNLTGDPALDPAGLQDNGGPTQTIALQVGSPASDVGSNALALDADGSTPLSHDQRGTGFARIIHTTVDMGAYETPLILPNITTQPQGQTIPSGTTATLSVLAAGTLPLSYQWYQGVAPVTSTPVGTNSPVFTTPTLAATTSYWVRITNDVGHTDSATAAITVNAGTCPTFPYTVPSGDAGALKLAILCANSNGAGTNDVINLSAGTYVLSVADNAVDGGSGLPVIEAASAQGTLTIHGNGATIMRSGASGVGQFRILLMTFGSNLTIDSLTLANGYLTNNYGAGIYDKGGTLTASSVTFANNNGAGALTNNYSGTLTLTRSTFSGNSAYSWGGGGGIYNVGGTVKVSSGLFVNNSSSFGGAILNYDLATIANSTFYFNSASEGGGIYNATGTLTVNNSTFYKNAGSNVGGGIYNWSYAAATVNNTVVAGSTSGGDCYNSGGITLSYSLIADGTCGIVSGSDGNLTGDPLLDPAGLQDNGGSSLTIALMPGSPAVDSGSNALALDADGTPLSTDQRGAPFPRIIDGIVDRGAFESSAVISVGLDLQGRSGTSGTSFVTDVHVTITPVVGGSPVLLTTDPIFDGMLTTDQSGGFVLSIAPGTYQFRVKGTHTLARMITVAVIQGDNLLDMPILPEGDANDDNAVTIQDFAILAATFGKTVGQAGYDGRADFNGDGAITILDFSLLALNFGQVGSPA